MANNPLEDRLLTAAEAARYLGYSEGTVRNKASRGQIPSVKLGHALRFRLSELAAWVEQQDAEAKKAARGKAPGADADSDSEAAA